MISRDVKFRDNEFTQMKRLCEILSKKNDIYHDSENDSDKYEKVMIDILTKKMNVDDYLPDHLMTKDAIARMFGDERTRSDKVSNENIDETNNRSKRQRVNEEDKTESKEENNELNKNNERVNDNERVNKMNE